MTTILSETRERLLRAIVSQVEPERIAEIHFFAPIKQGGVESGVAVIAATRELPVPAVVADTSEPVAELGEEPVSEPGEELGEEPVDEAIDEPVEAAARSEERHVVYTARYRLTLKGPDRGKWESNVVAEAEAPLITVDVVVRGVQRRVGDADEPERMSGEEVRAALAARA